MTQDTSRRQPPEPSDQRTAHMPPPGSAAGAPEQGTRPSSAEPRGDAVVSEPRLQREAVVLVHDRGRFAVLVAVSTLAGVALGFALGTFAREPAPSSSELELVSAAAERASMRASPNPPICAPPVPMPGTVPGDLLWRHGPQVWGRAPPVQLGVELEEHDRGPRVIRVEPGSGASDAGIQAGDVITSIDGEAIATASQLTRAVREHESGDKVRVTLDRAGDQLTLSCEVGE